MRLKYIIASLFIAALMMFGFTLSGTESVLIDADAKSNKEIQSEIDSLSARMANISNEQKVLKDKINQAHSTAKTLSVEISDLNYEIALIDEQIIVTDELIAQYEALLTEQENEIAGLEVKIENEKRILDQMIRLSFEYSGTGSAIEFIFSAEDLGDLLSRIDLLGYHLAYNDRVIENYSTSLKDLEDTKKSYESAKETLSKYRDEQAARIEELEDKKAEVESKKSRVLADAKEYEKDLAEKQKFINELDSEIKELAAMLAKDDKTTYTGTFTFPLPANVYRITSYYGNRKDPFTGKTAYHSGYDFACAKGTKIYAADSGTVVIAKWNGGYGNCVTINHGGGIMTLYGHCSELLVTAGQKVSRGDVIAKVGSTGRSTGNHLHFEVRKNGSVIDPSPYIGLK